MSVWEMREARKKLKEEGAKVVDENAILRAYRLMHQVVRSAGQQTKTARKEAQRKRLHARAERPIEAPKRDVSDTLEGGGILPFEDIDV